MKLSRYLILSHVFLCLSFLRAETLIRDLCYGEAGGEVLKLDACVPEGAGPFPVAILVHGGGWSGGDKATDITPWFKALTEGRYLWFSINYRLAPKHRWPACSDDVALALRWIKAHAASYGGDPSRVALLGYSAGGHLAFYNAATGGDDLKVQALVGYAPVTDFVHELPNRGGLSTSLQALLDKPKELTPESALLLRDLSPISHVHPGMPPVLILHGTADKTVPLGESYNLKKRLARMGVSCEILEIPGAGHRLTEWDKFDPTHGDRLLTWLNAQFHWQP